MLCTKFEKLDILIDNQNSWIWQYVPKIETICKQYTDNVRIFKTADSIQHGNVMFILSCDKILKKNFLEYHDNNIVIHASDLPKGKGWSPWTWEIESGATSITLTLFEADEKLDSGDWYIKTKCPLNGYELIDDIRDKLIHTQIDMIETYLRTYPVESVEQSGIETFYPKRNTSNQKLNIDSSLRELFNHLRVCDNERYPAYFYMDDQKYILKIYHSEDI